MGTPDKNQIIKNELLNKLLKNKIESTDTISQFMEKCNNNFSIISRLGGGPTGIKGDRGSQGVPTKPKVPIHVWKKNVEYKSEELNENSNEYILTLNDDIINLADEKYQDGHLILLENAHVYILNVEDDTLKPQFVCAMDSYDISKIDDEKKAHVHFLYSDDPYKDYPSHIKSINEETGRYIGIYSNNSENVPSDAKFTWSRMGKDGKDGTNGTNGTDGESAYVHFKYLNEVDENTLEKLKKEAINDRYLGICSDNNVNGPTNNNAYTWVRLGGDGVTPKFKIDDNNNLSVSYDGGKEYQGLGKNGILNNSLDTKQESNRDKVVVDGNNIRIVDSNGYTSTLITSDEINVETEGNTEYNHLYSWDILYNNVKYTPNESNNNYTVDLKSSYKEIGYISDISDVTFTIIASISNLTQDTWKFDENSIKLLIEKYDEENRYWSPYGEELTLTDLDGSWLPCDYFGNTYDGTYDEKSYYKTKSTDIFNNFDKGCYRFKTYIDSIYDNSSSGINEESSISLTIKCEIKDHLIYDSINRTEIGKNGIVVNLRNSDDGETNNNTEFHVLKDEILMRVGQIGLKINSEGIYKTTNYIDDPYSWEQMF